MIYSLLIRVRYKLLIVYFSVSSIRCYAPKLEWVNNTVIFPRHTFAEVECDNGLQMCYGGCKYCTALYGAITSKSCAGEDDFNLQTFGLHQDGCKDVSLNQSRRYSKMLSDSLLERKKLEFNITRICRCSWNGCNGFHGMMNQVYNINSLAPTRISYQGKKLMYNLILQLDIFIACF